MVAGLGGTLSLASYPCEKEERGVGVQIALSVLHSARDSFAVNTPDKGERVDQRVLRWNGCKKHVYA